MRLVDLISGEAVRVVQGDPEAIRVCDLTEDSRTAVPGSLFVARRGLKSDGRAFVLSAVEAGATCVLTDDPAAASGLGEHVGVLIAEDVPLVCARFAERFFGNPSSSLFLIGVTGTNGKTSVSHIVHHLLNAARVRCGLIGTVTIDDGRGPARAEMTTPPAIEISRTLATMIEAGCRAAVMEVSSHALDQRRADALAFDAAIITNITRDHLDYHGTMRAYAAAKARLFSLLDAATGGRGPSIVNADDPDAVAIAGRRVLACTASGAALGGWSVRTVSASLDGSRLAIRGPGVAFEQFVSFTGRHNAMNILQATAAAFAALRACGMGEAEAVAALQRGLSLVYPPPGRLEPTHGRGDDIAAFVDYAHTDDALDRTLSAVREALPAGRSLWVVFGAGGDRDAGKRPRMGRAAALRADRVVLTSDNPRTESPSRIISEVLSGVPDALRARVLVHADRRVAIERAVLEAAPGDAVVVAGKGHEAEQIMPRADGNGVESRPFDDRAECRRALGLRRVRSAQPGPQGAVMGAVP